MKNNKKIEITPDLYTQISQEKVSTIVSLKEEKNSTMEIIESKKVQLADLLEQKRQLECHLEELRESLQESRTKKFKITREIGKERRLVQKLNRAFTKGTHINLNKFVKQEEQSKRR